MNSLLDEIRAYQRRADRRPARPLSDAEARQAVVNALMPTATPRGGVADYARPSQQPGLLARRPDTITSREPTLGERLQNAVSDSLRGLGFSNAYAGQRGQEAVNLPILGDLIMGGEGISNYARGNRAQGLGEIGLAALGVVPGAGDAAVAGGRRIASATLARENYRTNISRYAPTLYRETSPDRAFGFIPNSGVSGNRDDMAEMFFADTPDMALGQGANRGVLVEVDAGDLQGRVNTQKPTWAHSWDQGSGEYVLNYNAPHDFQQNLRAITIRPDAHFERPWMRERMTRTLNQLQEQGWAASRASDGSLTLRRP